MHLSNAHISLVAGVAAVVLGASAPGAATAANDSADGDSASPAIVLAELGRGEQRFIPGVTDSGTGVLREREHRLGERPAPVASDSGFDLAGDAGAVVAGAALAAAVVASLAIAGGRRRRIAL
jgi:hypothetical protein